jgi:spore coat polysaccharide biosynthesis protein SpsF
MIPAFITVRSASSRLPGKCLLPFGDVRVIEHVITRAMHYELDPIVCTTVEPEDDVLVSIAEAYGVRCFRGAVDNKLKRWADCCAHFDISAFHTVDADDPFFDGEEMARSFALLNDQGWDIVAPTPSSSAGGASSGYSLTRDIVDRSVALTKPDDDTEMMWYWVDKVTGVKKTVLKEIDPDPITVRLTLDYEEDYWLLASVLRMIGGMAGREEINGLFRTNPSLYKVNWFRNEAWAAGQKAKKI